MKKQTIQLPPAVFKAEKTEEGTVVEIIDDELLFRDAEKLFRENKFLLAYRKYLLIIKNFNKSPYLLPSFYNSGLCLLKSQKYKESVEYFEKYINEVKNEKEKIDGKIKLLEAFAGAKEYDRAIELANALINEKALGSLERIEIYATLGHCLRMKRNFIEAEEYLKKALKEYKIWSEQNTIISLESVAMANYELGEIYRELFSEIKFYLPVEVMEKNLIDKTNFFLKAQKNYLDAIRFQSPYYSSAAGYQIGKLYESFYFDLLSAEVPKELNEEEVKIYFEELKKKIKPLIERAIEIYERNLAYSLNMGFKTQWVEKTQERLEFFKNFFRSE